MAKYLDPKYDLTFKRVFGVHKHLCISLINSMLPFEKGRELVHIEYLPSELVPELDVLKHSVVDVCCTDSLGRQFIVEMQMNWTESFKSRVLLNASKAYVRQLDAAEKFKTLQPVYAINFVNDIFEKSPEMANEYYHYYKVANVARTEKRIDGLEFVFVELPKFKPANRAEKKLHELWLRFLTEINGRTEEAPRELMECAETREAMKCVEVSAYTKEQLERYDKARIAVMTACSMLSDAEEKGVAQGVVQGIAQGVVQGRAEGEQERQKLQQENDELKRKLGIDPSK